MIGVSLGDLAREVEKLLVVGCHPDDVEIGAGGTILSLLRARPDVRVTWVVLAASPERHAEARACAEAFLTGASDADVRIHDFRDGFLPYSGGAVKEVFEGLKDVEPDLVLTHARHDLHQDHRLACELTWNTFRRHLILEYEIPKYDGDLGAPNLFVPLGDDVVDEKLRLLVAHHRSQQGKHWFDDDLFRSLMRLRGMECGARHAEAFTARKLLLTS